MNVSHANAASHTARSQEGSFRYSYAVIGGDLRQVYLAEELAKIYPAVCHYALCQPVSAAAGASSLEEACHSSAGIVCPIPFSKDGIFLNQNSTKENIPIDSILSLLYPGQRLYAGCIASAFQQKAQEKGIAAFDFMQDQRLSHFNTIATAEGILCEAIQACPKNLRQSRCAVLGYGKCGRTLTDLLKRIYCFVTVAAAPEEELAQAAVFADNVISLEQLTDAIFQYDVIINTIPAVILTKEILRQANPRSVILDIASYPGGVDFAAAREYSLTALSCPGLPGRYAPLSSAKAILASIQTFERSSPCL